MKLLTPTHLLTTHAISCLKYQREYYDIHVRFLFCILVIYLEEIFEIILFLTNIFNNLDPIINATYPVWMSVNISKHYEYWEVC